MIRGGDFYAIWIEDRGLWSTEEQDALQLIDMELDQYARNNQAYLGENARVLHMWDAETGMIDSWHKYCQKQMNRMMILKIHTILELAVYSRRFVVKSPKNVTANSSLLWNIR